MTAPEQNDRIHPDSLIIPANTVEIVKPEDLRPGDLVYRLGEHKGRTTLTQAVVHHRSENGAVYTKENGIITSPSDEHVYRVPGEGTHPERSAGSVPDVARAAAAASAAMNTAAVTVRAKTRPPVIPLAGI